MDHRKSQCKSLESEKVLLENLIDCVMCVGVCDESHIRHILG